MFEAVRHKILDLLAFHDEIFVAYSGGLDSHALLHLVANLRHTAKTTFKLTAVHVNHNLNSHAKEWVKHCQKTVEDLQVEFIAQEIKVETVPNKCSLEERLRNLRYEVFAKVLPNNGCLLTAHQANDQAETLLLQLFRGAGPKGLAAMPEKIEFAAGWLVRPLLHFSRCEILQYALQHELKWVEDESNLNLKFDRNLIRHRLLPTIKERWLGVDAVLGRVAAHCAEADELLGVLAAQDLQYVVTRDNAETVDVRLLKKLSFIRQKNILRFWLQQKQLPMPSEVKLNEVIRTVVNSRYDAMPMVKWLGVEARRFRHGLYAMPPLTPHDNKMILPFCIGKAITLPGNLGVYEIMLNPEVKLDPEKIIIGFRQGGEKIKLPTRYGSHELKQLMQEWGIPPWLRDRIPLMYYSDEIIAVVGYWSINGIQFHRDNGTP